jgi:hypothetical protein
MNNRSVYEFYNYSRIVISIILLPATTVKEALHCGKAIILSSKYSGNSCNISMQRLLRLTVIGEFLCH